MDTEAVEADATDDATEAMDDVMLSVSDLVGLGRSGGRLDGGRGGGADGRTGLDVAILAGRFALLNLEVGGPSFPSGLRAEEISFVVKGLVNELFSGCGSFGLSRESFLSCWMGGSGALPLLLLTF